MVHRSQWQARSKGVDGTLHVRRAFGHRWRCADPRRGGRDRPQPSAGPGNRAVRGRVRVLAGRRRIQQRRLRLRRDGPTGAAPSRRPLPLRRRCLGNRKRHHPPRAGAGGWNDLQSGGRHGAVGAGLPQRGRQADACGQVRAVRRGGQRRVLVQPVPAAGVHDAGGLSVPAGAQRLPAVLAGRVRERRRRRHRCRRRPVPARRSRGRVRGLHR